MLIIPINHFSWSDSLPCHSAFAHCHYTAIGLIALKRETQKYCLWLLKKRLVNSYFQIRFSFSFGRWLLTISSLSWWLLWRPPSHHRHGGGSRASCSQRHTETCSQVEPRARTAPCRPLLCIFQKSSFWHLDYWVYITVLFDRCWCWPLKVVFLFCLWYTWIFTSSPLQWSSWFLDFRCGTISTTIYNDHFSHI